MLNIMSHQEGQVKTSVKYHCTFIRRPKIKKMILPRVNENVEQLELSYAAGSNVK